MNSLTIKISGIIVSLVLMIAAVAAAVAYTSYNQETRVSADVIMSIDFGNVFPGTQVTRSFTVSDDNLTSESPFNYQLTMLPPSGTGLNDIRPYLVIEKDPSEQESEPDWIADGRADPPDYTAEGTLTYPEDQSDTWLVTFYVPDVNGVDYGCEISITQIQPGVKTNG